MERVLLSPNSAAHALDLSRSKVYELMKTGKIGYVYVDADRRIPVEEIQRIASQGTATAKAA